MQQNQMKYHADAIMINLTEQQHTAKSFGKDSVLGFQTSAFMDCQTVFIIIYMIYQILTTKELSANKYLCYRERVVP